MTISRTAIAKGFVTVADRHGIKRAIRELAALILEQRLHGQLEEILQDISLEYKNRHGFVEAEVKTAFQLGSGVKRQLEQYIKQHTSAKTVLLHEIIDSSLLGGMVLTAPDLELDSSLKTKLAKLKA